ncbi:hypothetical protein HAT2_00712 [Candidatus Similichlamydia laticola]|uniref:Uncharacterized protein n=1 Tax=Candidatus Similichlamydia laticola TaxID=2170265 RepID=A0A369KCA7_9BACT|nr:hypothetical protein HAT2_00712 [Candidatus Similichlamydia laticola]
MTHSATTFLRICLAFAFLLPFAFLGTQALGTCLIHCCIDLQLFSLITACLMGILSLLVFSWKVVLAPTSKLYHSPLYSMVRAMTDVMLVTNKWFLANPLLFFG